MKQQAKKSNRGRHTEPDKKKQVYVRESLIKWATEKYGSVNQALHEFYSQMMK